MEKRAKLVEILNQLVRVEFDGDPSITTIEGAAPNLRRMDWINRYGPAKDWEGILSSFSTKNLERLVKIIVIAEREYNWSGGSVAAVIWMYRIYSDRTDADPDALAEWVLRNRGNGYLPFGSMTSARTVEEWRIEQRLREDRWAAYQVREREQRVAKLKRGEERAKQLPIRNAQRREASQRRHAEIEERVQQLRELDCARRLSVLATNTALPLAAIPSSLIVECASAASTLDNETKQALLKRIDRRQGKVWKDLRAALIKS